MSSRDDRAAGRRREWATKESLLEDDLCSLGPPSLLDAEEDEADGRETRGALVAAELDDAPTGVYAVPASVVFDASSAGETSPSTTRRLLVRNCGAKSVPVVVMRPESRRYDVRPAVASLHDERDAASALWEGAPAGAAVALRLIRPGETHLFIVTRRAASEEDLDAKEAEDEYDEYGQPRRRRRRRRGGAPLAPPAALYIFTRYFPLRVPLLVEGGSMAPPPSPRRGGPLEEARPRSMLSVCGPPPLAAQVLAHRGGERVEEARAGDAEILALRLVRQLQRNREHVLSIRGEEDLRELHHTLRRRRPHVDDRVHQKRAHDRQERAQRDGVARVAAALREECSERRHLQREVLPHQVRVVLHYVRDQRQEVLQRRSDARGARRRRDLLDVHEALQLNL